MVIYKITNLINGMFYVGKKEDTKELFLKSNYYGSGIIIKRAIKKYGKEFFKREIIEECKNRSQLLKREKFWIKELNSRFPIGYNITEGGEDTDTLSKHPNKKEICERLSKSRKLLWQNQEYRKKQFENRPDRHGKNNSMFGKKQTHESNEKNRKAHLGKIPWNKGLTRETDERVNNNYKNN